MRKSKIDLFFDTINSLSYDKRKVDDSYVVKLLTLVFGKEMIHYVIELIKIDVNRMADTKVNLGYIKFKNIKYEFNENIVNCLVKYIKSRMQNNNDYTIDNILKILSEQSKYCLLRFVIYHMISSQHKSHFTQQIICTNINTAMEQLLLCIRNLMEIVRSNKDVNLINFIIMSCLTQSKFIDKSDLENYLKKIGSHKNETGSYDMPKIEVINNQNVNSEVVSETLNSNSLIERPIEISEINDYTEYHNYCNSDLKNNVCYCINFTNNIGNIGTVVKYYHDKNKVESDYLKILDVNINIQQNVIEALQMIDDAELLKMKILESSPRLKRFYSAIKKPLISIFAENQEINDNINYGEAIFFMVCGLINAFRTYFLYKTNPELQKKHNNGGIDRIDKYKYLLYMFLGLGKIYIS